MKETGERRTGGEREECASTWSMQKTGGGKRFLSSLFHVRVKLNKALEVDAGFVIEERQWCFKFEF